MVDRLDGLRHDVIVGSDDDDSDIGHLSTTGTHRCKCFVPRSIQESDRPAVTQFYVVSSDMLCDTTGFTCDDIGFTNTIQ